MTSPPVSLSDLTDDLFSHVDQVCQWIPVLYDRGCICAMKPSFMTFPLFSQGSATCLTMFEWVIIQDDGLSQVTPVHCAADRPGCRRFTSSVGSADGLSESARRGAGRSTSWFSSADTGGPAGRDRTSSHRHAEWRSRRLGCGGGGPVAAGRPRPLVL